MKMKRIYKYTLMSLFAFVMLSCDPDDTPDQSAQDLAFERLSGQWTLGVSGFIKVDNQDISLNYPGFALSFTDGGYTTTNAGDLFRSSGTWTWANELAGSINLDDGKEITISNLDVNSFRFTFPFAGTGGVPNGTAGNYDIQVVK